MWAGVAKRAAADVTLGALEVVARHFDVAPEELVLAGGPRPVLDGWVNGYRVVLVCVRRMVHIPVNRI